MATHKTKLKDKEASPPYMESISKSATSLKHLQRSATVDNDQPPPIPPLPLHYQRSDGKFVLGRLFILRNS